MLTGLAPALYVLARLLLGGTFVVFALRNIRAIPRLAETLAARRLPWPRACATIGVALQLVGGLLAAIGPWPALGGVLMIVFLVLATVLFHPVWKYSGEARDPHINPTIMNTGLVGAFLLLVATAPL